MAASDSESERGGSGETVKSLESAGRELVHDVATPLATIQLNLQVLSNYLPKLMSLCADTAEVPSGINPDHLHALASLPHALDADIRKIRQAVQLFTSILVPEKPAQMSPVAEISFRESAPALRVLLVEDEVIHQEITLKQLTGRGRVDVAATGRQALDLLARGNYDLVLLDLMLSGQDARSLVGELRALGRDDLRIILVSNMPLSVDEVRQLKADGALEKPFRFVSLEALLQGLAKPATV
jgi:CheY-like chemotaxis protein